MIEVRGLTKSYGDVRAVDDLSFDVEPGNVTGFLGPNGAGKSTTMRMILGLDKPSTWDRRRSDATHGCSPRLGMPTVERADPDGEYEVEQLLVLLQCEVLNRDRAGAQATGGELGGRSGAQLVDGRG